MSNDRLFFVWDKKYKKWAGFQGENGRTFEQYQREKTFKNSGLMWCDIDGFAVDEYGQVILRDECGREMYLDPKRFVASFLKESLESSPSGAYWNQKEEKADT